MFKWTIEELQKAALQCKSRGEFQKLFQCQYESARTRGLLELICSHIPSLHVKWNKSLIIESAKTFASRKEFEQKNPRAYTAARRYGL
jgi:hypothetical protein